MNAGDNREQVLGLILQQLSAYGYSNLSQAIATHTKVAMTAESSSRLAELVSAGQRAEKRQQADSMSVDDDRSEAGDADGAAPVAAARAYSVWYQTRHKGAATAAGFSRDGRYVATGSADASLKVMEVARMRGAARVEDKPVIRTLYHHAAEITGVAFHPNGLVLASCSEDRTIKLFDLSAAQGKYSFQSMRDNHAFRALAFHPSGEYLAAAGDAREVRLYNVASGKAFLLAGRHAGPVTHVDYASTGALVASASRDGSVKLWDGASGKCVRTLDGAHGGHGVAGAVFSRSARQLLTTGADSRACVWDVGSGRAVATCEGARLDASGSAHAVFAHDGAVLAADARLNDVATWDAASGRLVGRGAPHKQAITCIAASPTAAAFMTCSVDEGVRYWGAN
ncbi:hypothetical protein GGI04_000624 [Coemansia thaxteri]|uniref:Cleavage stimulation factor 50 kDa subunit n=1 Tax=Coemansia thaxteri TaxID=2663907 RepID=A0A9W8EE77_9FUNG|nr:hypothetical protein H4R26_004240 [Coemansia thaxteri]KAJ2009244.1 hypothetical protein GGI04_000624 [Coemansia thaxteri]KAJ2474167.1 hypothetical protein GGI02_000294 [Coemansia sp. RSA 2322]KAJ2476943.1 hypothetical protein EV174_004769 [Coemansia sp. RSA 2320]